MSLNNLKIRFTFRGDTAENWRNVNPVLLQNEAGRETDTNRVKFGDGTTAWNGLPYVDKRLEDAIAALEAKFDGGKANAAETADKLAVARNIALSGAVTGAATFDGSENIEINATLANLDASKITTGTIDIARLPKGALDNLVLVTNDAERFALTTKDVQNGDTVKVTETGILYLVSDETKLGTAEAFTEYTAGRATAIDWSGVENKPTEFRPEAHTHKSSDVTAMTGYTGTYFEETDSLNAALKKVEDKVVLASERYTLPAASADTLGGVKIGKNITVTDDGTISVADAADLTPYAKKEDVLTGDLTGTVAAPSIAAGVVNTDKLTDGAVNTAKLANEAVNTAKLAIGAVTDDKIAAASLSTTKLFVPAGDTLVLEGGTASL